MGLDKLRGVTPRRPGSTWFDMINADYRRLPEERHFNYNFKFRDQKEVDSIGITAEARISTKKGIVPQYMVELNFLTPGGTQPPLTVFETNPNNYPRGWPQVERTVTEIFGDTEEIKNTRLDLNAEAVDVSVHYFRDSLRVPLKRASAAISKSAEGGELWARKDVETIYIGKSPARLRVYDKIQEMKFQGKETGFMPKILTRLEWELRGVRCPIEKFSDIPKLLQDCRPFAAIQLQEVPAYYDYKIDPIPSMRRRLYHALVEDMGLHDTVRIMNHERHFSRDFRGIVFQNEELKQKIERSYFESNQRLLDGKPAHVEAIYLKCLWCRQGDDVTSCEACGVPLCTSCAELYQMHDAKCPTRKESH
jgi:hypothetical protein